MADLPVINISANLFHCVIDCTVEWPIITLAGSLEAETFPVISGAITVPMQVTAGTLYNGKMFSGSFTLPAIDATAELVAPVYIESSLSMPALTIAATIYRPPLGDLWAARPRNNIYTCTFSADGFDDLVVPISSWQARFRTDEAQSYVAVVVPGISYYSDIADRVDGTLTIKKGWKFLDTDEEFLTAIITADIDSIADDEGARNASITVTSYTQLTAAAKTVTLDNLFYRAIGNDGKVRWRTELYLDIDSDGDFFIKPGDTVEYNEDAIEADFISIAVSIGQEVMEIKAA